jgi:hypothetical protein
VVDPGFDPGPFKPKTIKLVFVASLLSMQHYRVLVRTKASWLGIIQMKHCSLGIKQHSSFDLYKETDNEDRLRRYTS